MLPLVRQVIRDLAADSDFWLDSVWIADSTPVECGRSRFPGRGAARAAPNLPPGVARQPSQAIPLAKANARPEAGQA